VLDLALGSVGAGDQRNAAQGRTILLFEVTPHLH
jgi:hypothetical protein